MILVAVGLYRIKKAVTQDVEDELDLGGMSASQHQWIRRLAVVGEIGRGGVAYVALGHCHNPAIRTARAADPTDTTPLTFRGSWESDAFLTLLRNAIAWGTGMSGA